MTALVDHQDFLHSGQGVDGSDTKNIGINVCLLEGAINMGQEGSHSPCYLKAQTCVVISTPKPRNEFSDTTLHFFFCGKKNRTKTEKQSEL